MLNSRVNVVFFNYTTMQMTAKIVYYGPGLCGKTTNLQHIHQKTAAKSRGEMVSLETETDRTLFFDLLPLDVGFIGGMKVRLQLYTVPGQVFYNATRKLVLKGVDGIVFVADSQVSMLDSNVESLQNLQANLAELGLSLDQVPVVLQYNKRDIRNIHPVPKLNEILNSKGIPFFEAAALHGIGVFETLKAISRLALVSVRRKVLATEEKKPETPAGPRAAVVAPAPPVPPASRAAAPAIPPPIAPPAARPVAPPQASAPVAAGDDLLAQLVADAPAVPEEVPLEFAEEDPDQNVRPVATKAHVDIQDELEKLRTLAGVGGSSRSGASKQVEKRLQDLLVSDRDARQDVKRKAVLDVPGELLKGSAAMKIHVAFEGPGGNEQVLRDAITVKLVGNRRLERLTLHIDLELKAK